MVKVVVTSEEGEEMVLVTLGPGEALGELSIVDGGARSASAEALEPTVALMITREVLLDLVTRDRGLTEALLRTLGALLRRLTEQASDLVFLDLPGRMAKLLAGLAAEHGSETPEGIELDANLTQTDLAGMVGASRQSVNQILQGFARRGYLQVRGRRIVIHRLDLLRRRPPRPGVGRLTVASVGVPDSRPAPTGTTGTGSGGPSGTARRKEQVMREHRLRRGVEGKCPQRDAAEGSRATPASAMDPKPPRGPRTTSRATSGRMRRRGSADDVAATAGRLDDDASAQTARGSNVAGVPCSRTEVAGPGAARPHG